MSQLLSRVSIILIQEQTVPTKLTLDQMKKFVREHFEDFVNQRNAAVIRKNMTPDFYDHNGPGGKPTGVDGDEQMMIAMYRSMPDLHLQVEDMIAESDKVMCRNVWRWTDPTSGQKALCCGASRETKSPNGGPQWLRRSRKRRRRRSKQPKLCKFPLRNGKNHDQIHGRH